MSKEPLNIDDLLTQIQNYQLSRKTAPRSIQPWLDRLIEDAECKIAALRNPSPGGPSLGDPPATEEPGGRAGSPHQSFEHPHAKARQTYPFDENAPWQRIN